MPLRYLLDTNILSDLIRLPQGAIASRIASAGENTICTSIVVAAELRFGAENARLIALLESHGIGWRPIPAYSTPANQALGAANLSTAEKVALFRRLFRGRTDVYPVRWESATTGRSGYAPACANEWRARVCEKPRVKCAEFGRSGSADIER